jgi:hypothetical protein
MGEKIRKIQVLLRGTNGTKRVSRTWKMKEMVVQDLTEPVNTLKKCRMAHSDRCLSITRVCYGGILKRLHEAVRRERPELWPNDWILHHDSSTANKALSVKQFLDQKPITEMAHPPYSPNLAPNDLLLFPKITSVFEGRRFQDTGDIQKRTM